MKHVIFRLALSYLIIQSLFVITTALVAFANVDNLDTNRYLNFGHYLDVTLYSVDAEVPRGNIKVISANDRNKVISEGNNVSNYFISHYDFYWIDHYNRAKVRINIDWDRMFERLFGPPQGQTVVANMTVVEWDSGIYPPFQLLFMNDDGTVVLAESNEFKVTRNIKISWDKKNGIYPGENVAVDYFPRNTEYLKDYFKVFKVSQSLKETPLLFNSNEVATLTRVGTYNPVFVSWTEPGMYQVVFLSENGQTIIGLSDTFRVLRRTNQTKVFIKTDKQLYSAGENIKFNFQTQIPSIGWRGLNLIALFYPSNATVYSNTNTVLPSIEFRAITGLNLPFLLMEEYTYITLNLPLPFIGALRMTGEFTYGVLDPSKRYKIAFYMNYGEFFSYTPNSMISLFLVGVTKPIRVSNGISIQLPKRWIRKGETIPIRISNPYYNFTYDQQSSRFVQRFEIRIVTADPTERFNQSVVVATEPNLTINLDPGFYKFAFYSVLVYPVLGAKDRYEFDITNSSFRVIG